LLTLDLKDLEGNVGSAVEFLKSRLDDEVKVRGSSIQIRVLHARDAKLILHKYLRHAKLDGYRVVVVGPGLVKVEAQKMKERRRTRRRGGATPAPWETVPSQWYQRQSSMRRPKRRMSKRQKQRMIRGLD
jgi:hypothetical protein